MPQVSNFIVSWNGGGKEYVTFFKWMKWLPDSFPIIFAEVWVGVGGGGVVVLVSILVFLPFPCIY